MYDILLIFFGLTPQMLQQFEDFWPVKMLQILPSIIVHLMLKDMLNVKFSIMMHEDSNFFKVSE